ncbi:MAG: hypothetical protein A2Y13_04445 [Planctomycetes bacterium GWC2_45_44]|nr:MAG: hypothetical protein A2Y13_04445 [Planctomycetes bacterium GWC2_45_44]HBR19425.1 hypothetical protein [Phycisphaerales bacterium]
MFQGKCPFLSRVFCCCLVTLFLPSAFSKADSNEPGISKVNPNISYIEISPTPVAPQIDGRLDDKAWSYATAVTGFFALTKDGGQANDQTQVSVTYDKENLYIAFKSVLRGRRPRAVAEQRDGQVYSDESIEIFLFPPNGGQGKCYQFVGNCKGTIFDQTVEGEKGNREWNGNWKFANYVWDIEWNAEISIPLADMGVTEPTAGLWRMNFCRTCDQLTSWSPVQRGYAELDKFAYVAFTKNSLVNRLNSIEGLAYGDMSVKGSIFNPTNQEKQVNLKVAVADDALQSSSVKSIAMKLMPGETRNYSIEHLLKDLSLRLLQVEIEDNNKPIYRSINPFSLKERPKSFTIIPVPDANQILFSIDLSRIETENKTLNVKAAIVDQNGNACKTFSLENLGTKGKQVVCRDVGQLPLGKYSVIAECIDPASGKILETVKQSYEKLETPVWFSVGRTLGREEKVIPPWTPMEFDNISGSVKAWGRDYILSGNSGFLFNNIISQERKILKGPVELTARIGNKISMAKLVSRSIDDAKPYHIKWTDVYKLDTIRINCKCIAEFDGMVKVQMELDPCEATELDSLKLEIPLETDFSGLYHYSYNYYGSDFYGSVPQNGIEIDFANYVWAGGINRGLMWFSEGPENWNNLRKPIRFTREGFSIEFINTKSKIEKPISIVYGFQATPVRKIQPDWRAYNRIPENLIQSLATADAPLGNLTGKLNDIEFDRGYSDDGKCLSREAALGKDRSFTTPLTKDTRTIRNAVNLPCNKNRRNILYEYCNGASPRTTDFDKYSLSWQRLPIWTGDYNVQPHPEEHIITLTCYNSSYNDFMMYGIKYLVMQTGIDGIYFDGCGGPSTCENVLHGCSPRKDLQGRKVEMSPIFAAREFHKRLAIMLYELKGEKAYIMSHMSGCMALPVLSFCNAYLDGESPGAASAYGGPKITELTDFDYWLAHTQGADAGIASCFILYTDYTKPQKDPAVVRSYLTMFMVHGVPFYAGGDIGSDLYTSKMATAILKAQTYVNLETADFYGYWENEKYITLSPKNPDVVASFYENKENDRQKIMVIVSNRSKKSAETSIEFNKEKFGSLVNKVAYSVSDDYAAKIDNNKICLSVNPEDFIVFVIMEQNSKNDLVKHPSEY